MTYVFASALLYKVRVAVVQTRFIMRSSRQIYLQISGVGDIEYSALRVVNRIACVEQFER